MEKDFRNIRNRINIEKNKWVRNVKLQEDQILTKDSLIANPTNYKIRSRTESPPAKCHRTKKGINKGKPPGCSYCRPEISKRMLNTFHINNEVKQQFD